MNTDLKVGDLVKVHRWKDMENGTKCRFKPDMEPLVEGIFTINDIDKDGNCRLDTPWSWFEYYRFPSFALERCPPKESNKRTVEEDTGPVEFGTMDSHGLW